MTRPSKQTIRTDPPSQPSKPGQVGKPGRSGQTDPPSQPSQPGQAGHWPGELHLPHSREFIDQIRIRLRQRKFRLDAFIFLLLFIFGVIVMNHIQTVRASNPGSDLSERYKTRASELAQYEAQYQKLLEENARLTQEKEQVISNLLNQEGYESLQAELTRLRILAGFTPVTGSGVSLTIDDKVDYDVLTDPIDSIVHDSDIRYAINLLNGSGAAALAVNGQRIVNASYVFCIGPTILCNMQRLTPPYVITAIGNPALLADAVRQDPMFNLRQTPSIGLVVNIKEETELLIPAFAEADQFAKYIDRLEVAQP